MAESFYENTLTRRFLVQIVYQSNFNCFKRIDDYISDDYEFKSKIINHELFYNVLNKIFALLSSYDTIFDEYSIDLCGLSLVAIAMLKVSIAEFQSCKIDKNLIISEYLNIAGSFLDLYEIKIVNKILEKCLI